MSESTFWKDYDGDLSSGGILIVVILVIVCLGILISIPIIISENLDAIASEQAQKKCEGKGYDIYTSFRREFLESKALGVKCDYVDYNRKQIDVDTTEGVGNNPAVIVVTN